MSRLDPRSCLLPAVADSFLPASFKPSIPKGRGLPLPLSLPGTPAGALGPGRYAQMAQSAIQETLQKIHQKMIPKIRQKTPKMSPKSSQNRSQMVSGRVPRKNIKKNVEKVTPQNLENMVFALEGLQKSKNSPLQNTSKNTPKSHPK